MTKVKFILLRKRLDVVDISHYDDYYETEICIEHIIKYSEIHELEKHDLNNLCKDIVELNRRTTRTEKIDIIEIQNDDLTPLGLQQKLSDIKTEEENLKKKQQETKKKRDATRKHNAEKKKLEEAKRVLKEAGEL